MNIAINLPLEPAVSPQLPMYRFTVEQYHRMIQADILGENDRAELLEGWIVAKMTHNPPHDATVSFTKESLEEVIPDDWMLRIQSAITTEDSEPEPDIAVVRRPARRYVSSHPRRRDIGLLVEVADSSVLEDRVHKGRLYARARIPVYWLINLIESRVEVYSQPRAGRSPAYRQRHDYGMGESVPVVLDGREVGRLAVRDLLP